METIKMNLTMNRQKSKAVTYLTKEEAFNLNEAMEDIDYIVQEKGDVRILETKSSDNKIKLLGELTFSVLYCAASLEKHLSVYSGRIAFEEELNLEGIAPDDEVEVRATMDGLQVSIVNSRKLNVNVVIGLQAQVEENYEEEILTDVTDELNQVQTKKSEILLLKKMLGKRESCRVKEEIELPSGKENIGKLLWHVVTPYNVETQLKEGQIGIFGELQVFVIYISEESGKTENLLEHISFHQAISCEGVHEGQILKTNILHTDAEVEVVPDYDGEERCLHIECVMDLLNSVYQEEKTERLEDVYSIGATMTPVQSLLACEKLLQQNGAKYRVNQMVRMKGNAASVLQLLHGSGRLHNIELQQQDGGVLLEGRLEVNVLYITSDDERPYSSFKETIPFSSFVEIPNMSMQSEYQMDCQLEQLSVALAGNGELEVKALVGIHLFAYDIVLYPVIKEIVIGEMDMQRIQKIPGITGYVVKEEDTLWDIAKEYSTTIDGIKETNELKNNQIKAGDTLVIVKNVGEPISFS